MSFAVEAFGFLLLADEAQHIFHLSETDKMELLKDLKKLSTFSIKGKKLDCLKAC